MAIITDELNQDDNEFQRNHTTTRQEDDGVGVSGDINYEYVDEAKKKEIAFRKKRFRLLSACHRYNDQQKQRRRSSGVGVGIGGNSPLSGMAVGISPRPDPSSPMSTGIGSSLHRHIILCTYAISSSTLSYPHLILSYPHPNSHHQWLLESQRKSKLTSFQSNPHSTDGHHNCMLSSLTLQLLEVRLTLPSPYHN